MGDIQEFTIFYKKWIEPFVAVLILIMIVLLVLFIIREHNTTKQIQENCGWGDEDYYCWCEYEGVNEISRILDSEIYKANLSDIKELDNTELKDNLRFRKYG